jgi:hypothetical protein
VEILLSPKASIHVGHGVADGTATLALQEVFTLLAVRHRARKGEVLFDEICRKKGSRTCQPRRFDRLNGPSRIAADSRFSQSESPRPAGLVIPEQQPGNRVHWRFVNKD